MTRIGLVVFSGALMFWISGCGDAGQLPANQLPGAPHLSSNTYVTGVRCVSKADGSNEELFFNTYIEIYSDGTERVQSTATSKEKCN